VSCTLPDLCYGPHIQRLTEVVKSIFGLAFFFIISGASIFKHDELLFNKFGVRFWITMTLGRGMDVTNVIFCCPWNPESEVTLSKKMESKYEKMEVFFFHPGCCLVFSGPPCLTIVGNLDT
jgi:hypothetical protein